MPSEPVESGSSASIFLPISVVSEGEGVTVASKVCMMERRKGFCS